MAAPNIKTASSIIGKNAKLAITTTPTAILTNAASSGKVFKINLLNIANVDGSASASVTVTIDDGTAYPIAYTVAVPADNSLDILNKPLYLQEGETLKLTASADGDLVGVASYEEIS